MKSIYQIGDKVSLEFLVKDNDLAAFQGEMVHPFYSTFALGRDAEWTCRQFVLEMKESDEEGIGTFLNHARNYLTSTVANFEHKGFYKNATWGAKYQHEIISDNLSEWQNIDRNVRLGQ